MSAPDGSRLAIQPVILSGGSGTRLWPASRAARPKQFMSFLADETMLQATAGRLAQGRAAATFAAPIVVCNAAHRDPVLEQLAGAYGAPAAVLLEPEARNTAPAIAAVTAYIAADDPKALILVMPSDHHIGDAQAFAESCALGAQAALDGRIVVFGAPPTSPHTGYGYIEAGAPLAAGCEVARFREKPKLEDAQAFLDRGGFFWNAGIFLFRADVMREEMTVHCPDILAAAEDAVAKAKRKDNVVSLDKTSFSAASAISLDYAVMEPTRRAAVVPLETHWSDLGSWNAVWEAAERDVHGNAVLGDVLLEETKGVLAFSVGPAIAAVGVDDLVIVATEKAVLVLPRSRDQDVKTIVERLKKERRSDLL